MFIRSERLFLRPGWPEDWDELLARIAAEAVSDPAQAPLAHAAGPMRAFADAPQDRLLPHFLVTLPGADGARLVGCAGLAPGEGSAPELTFWIAPRHWGQGYATEATRAVLGLARALGHRRVVAHQFVDHAATGRVLAKVGFRPQGAPVARHCPVRQRAEAALCHAIDLAEPDNCGGDDGMRPMRRAA